MAFRTAWCIDCGTQFWPQWGQMECRCPRCEERRILQQERYERMQIQRREVDERQHEMQCERYKMAFEKSQEHEQRVFEKRYMVLKENRAAEREMHDMACEKYRMQCEEREAEHQRQVNMLTFQTQHEQECDKAQKQHDLERYKIQRQYDLERDKIQKQHDLECKKIESTYKQLESGGEVLAKCLSSIPRGKRMVFNFNNGTVILEDVIKT